MSLLSDNFSDTIRTLSLVKVYRFKNGIGETVTTEEVPIAFSGVIIPNTEGKNRLIDRTFPVHTSSHKLFVDFGGSTFARDDIVLDGDTRYTVKAIEKRQDIEGNDDHLVIYLDQFAR